MTGLATGSLLYDRAGTLTTFSALGVVDGEPQEQAVDTAVRFRARRLATSEMAQGAYATATWSLSFPLGTVLDTRSILTDDDTGEAFYIVGQPSQSVSPRTGLGRVHAYAECKT